MLLDFSTINHYKTEDYQEIWQQEIIAFIQLYLDKSSDLALKTSGSTGEPKTIHIAKKYLKNSALMTGNFFHLKAGNTALLCLPIQYIAGKMMIVRAIELKLQLFCVAPTAEVKLPVDQKIDFAAMVPMQVEKSLPYLNTIQQLIIGGAAISPYLVERLQTLQTACYATYGMTETVSHIALRKLNGKDKSDTYTTLEDIEIQQDENQCLRIICPKLSSEVVQTRDKVEIIDAKHFQFLGRLDYVINSGGVKIHPEILEQKLAPFLPNNRYFIASEPDSLLGEKVILIIESNAEITDLEHLLKQNLDSIERPKKIYYTQSFVETTTQKVNRKATLEKILT